MTTALLTPPSQEPVTLEEAKAHLRVTHDSEDTLINDLIRVAREHVEVKTNQKLLPQEWRQYEPHLNADRDLCVRVGPIRSITSVTVYAMDGTARILAAQEAWIDRTRHQERIAFSQVLPLSDAVNGLEIDLIVGISDIPPELPGSLRHAILLLVAHWFEFRGAVPTDQQPVSLPPGFDTLIRPHCQVRL